MNSNYSAQEKNFATALLHNLWKYLLLAASIVATVKIIFFGFDIDEQYAVSMAYRLVQGDRMFLEMWEPHQTSAFFSAAFLWLYMQLFHTLKYSVLFLRIVGVVTQLLISILTYRTFRKFVTENTAFVIAVFYYNIIPKNSTVPDFSNMLLWFSTLVFLSFLEFSLNRSTSARRPAFFLIAAGVSTSLLVLSYPTCIFVVLPGCIGIWLLSAAGNRLKNLLIYLGTCGVCGLGWLAYFLCHMSFRQFLDGLSEMLTDGSQDVGLLGKLKDNLSCLGETFPYLLVALVITLVFWCFFRFICRKNYRFFLLLIISLILEQLFVWYRLQKHIEYPGFVYLLFPLWGIYCYFRRKKSSGELAPVYKALFWFGSITSLFLLLAAFTASNTMLYESADYMAIGMLVSLCYAERETLESPVFWKSFVLLFVGLAVIHKGFLLYNIYGHDTIFVTRQKAEEGPMAGIYGRYSDGYEYNIRGRLLDEFIPRGSKVLIASHKSIMYLQEDYVICNYSTISTPTIDERLFQYWTLYPDKVPEYIVWDKGSEGYIATNPEVNARLVENAELLVDDEGLLIYRLPANPY